MRVHVVSGQLDRVHHDAVSVFAAFEAEQRPEKLIPSEALHHTDLLSRLAECGFRGALNETILLPLGKGWAIIVGVGKADAASPDVARQFAATAARFGRSRGFKRLAMPVLRGSAFGTIEKVSQAMAEGAVLGLYRFDAYRDVPKHERAKQIDDLALVVERAADVQPATKGAAKGEIVARAACFARDLINGPSNDVTPRYLANQAREIAKTFKLKCTVLGLDEMTAQGFGGVVGVGKGSDNEPQFIVLEYGPSKATPTFALCGKGITFDSGGISIKPSDNMQKMKYDMSGAAAVLGTVRAAAQLKLPARIIGIIAAADNVPSSKSQKPGDILRTLSGKTVEVINTDAEGRLVLADCLHYAKRFKPDCVVDLATLTSACVVALGGEAIGLFTKHNRLAERVTRAGEATRERVWRLPLWDEYAPLIKSDVADAKNTGGSGAGATTAAKFLELFADGLAWAHLDIAGTAWIDQDKPYRPKGAVGVGVRLLIELMEQWK